MENEGEGTNQGQEPVANEPFNPPTPKNIFLPEANQRPSDNSNSEIPMGQGPIVNVPDPVQSLEGNINGVSGSESMLTVDKNNNIKKWALYSMIFFVISVIIICFYLLSASMLPWGSAQTGVSGVKYSLPKCDSQEKNSSDGPQGKLYYQDCKIDALNTLFVVTSQKLNVNYLNYTNNEKALNDFVDTNVSKMLPLSSKATKEIDGNSAIEYVSDGQDNLGIFQNKGMVLINKDKGIIVWMFIQAPTVDQGDYDNFINSLEFE